MNRFVMIVTALFLSCTLCYAEKRGGGGRSHTTSHPNISGNNRSRVNNRRNNPLAYIPASHPQSPSIHNSRGSGTVNNNNHRGDRGRRHDRDGRFERPFGWPFFSLVIIPGYHQQAYNDVLVENDRIMGLFDGFYYGAQYTLQDGSIWEQVQHCNINYTVDSPRVCVYRSPSGQYFMRVEGIPNLVEFVRVD